MSNIDISVLLVEDDKILRSVYTEIIGMHVSKLYTADNGNQGYDSYLKNKPDLILTDIKMPVMNGIEMIAKIRENDKAIRIIIISAYSDSHFFLNAIETGVKGFLIKPVVTADLLNIIRDQANDILLEKRLKEEATKRRAAEKELDKGESILRALSQATAIFFSKGVNDQTVNNILKLIGEAADVSRGYIFKLHEKNENEYISQIYEWVAQGIVPQIHNEDLQDIITDDPIFLPWKKKMSNRQNILGLINDFDEPTKTILMEQDICSLLAIPIYVKNSWWGFIGFDDCVSNRIWSDSEINALEMLAFNLGGALYRREVEDKMTRLNASLEERVWERTKDLEQEVVERTIAENLLRDSEEKYRLIYENANDGILLIVNNIISLVNPKFIEIIGMLPNKVIGTMFSSLVKTEFVEKVDKYFNPKDENDEVTSEMQVQ
ncbi:MAG TPA: response regulator, partial [Bacteroidales bacterium]|nr:response regulator [Bacteroidales bacterium]